MEEQASIPETPDAADSQLLTFLIADVRGYTEFTQQEGDEAAAALAAKFAAVTREGAEARGGQLLELRGDEAVVVFQSPRQAIRTAADLQDRFQSVTFEDPDLPLEVGIGLDVGEAIRVEGGFRGGALNLASRLCSIAGPGQIFVSEPVVHLARRVKGLVYRQAGARSLKGFAEPVRVIEIVREGGPGVDASDPLATNENGTPEWRAAAVSPFIGFLGAEPRNPLIAREDELARVGAAIQAASSGSGRVIALSGEAGVGKTRLAQEGILEAAKSGFVIAAGTCSEQRQAVALYPFRDVLEAILSAAPEEIRTSVPDRWPDLFRLLPDQDLQPTPKESDGGGEEDRLFRQVAEFVNVVAEARPVCIALDDIQWADDASLNLIRRIARSSRTVPLLVILAYRDDDEAGGMLSSTMLDLYRHQIGDHIPIQRLTGKQTAALIEAMLEGEAPPGLDDLVQDRTEGNPFFTEEVVRSLLERGDVFSEAGQWQMRRLEEIEVPQRARAVIEQRLGRFDETQRDVLREASVLGRRFRFDDLLLVTGRPEHDIEDAVRTATASDLIFEVGRDEYAFRHALTRQALYQDLGPRRRRRLHAATAGILEERAKALSGRAGAPDGELAWHFLQADEPARALPHFVRAADSAEAVFAHEEAERLYRAALGILWELEPPLDGSNGHLELIGADILEKLGGVLRTMGRYGEALENLDLAAQNRRDLNDRDGEARIAALSSVVLGYLERHSEGIERIEQLVEDEQTMARLSSRTRALLYLSLAQLLSMENRTAEALRAARTAAEISASAGDNRLGSEAETRVGEALALLGRHTEAQAVLKRVIPQAERDDLWTVARALNGLGIACVASGEFLHARGYMERAVETAERLQDRRILVVCLLGLGRIMFLLGGWNRSLQVLEQAEPLAAELPVTGPADEARLARLVVDVFRGKWDGLDEALEDLAGRALQEQHPRLGMLVNGTRAELAILRNRPDQAERLLDPLLSIDSIGQVDRAAFNTLLARARVAQGRIGEAADAAGAAFESAGLSKSQPVVASALWCMARVRSQQEQWDAAQRLFDAAGKLARAMPYPFVQAGVLLDRGIMELTRGEKDAAREHIQSARETFRHLGARPFVERAAEALEGIGVEPSRR